MVGLVPALVVAVPVIMLASFAVLSSYPSIEASALCLNNKAGAAEIDAMRKTLIMATTITNLRLYVAFIEIFIARLHLRDHVKAYLLI